MVNTICLKALLIEKGFAKVLPDQAPRTLRTTMRVAIKSPPKQLYCARKQKNFMHSRNEALLDFLDGVSSFVEGFESKKSHKEIVLHCAKQNRVLNKKWIGLDRAPHDRKVVITEGTTGRMEALQRVFHEISIFTSRIAEEVDRSGEQGIFRNISEDTAKQVFLNNTRDLKNHVHKITSTVPSFYDEMEEDASQHSNLAISGIIDTFKEFLEALTDFFTNMSDAGDNAKESVSSARHYGQKMRKTVTLLHIQIKNMERTYTLDVV